MTYQPPSAPYRRFSLLLRRGLDPRSSAEERAQALHEMEWSTEELTELADDAAFGSVMEAVSAPCEVSNRPTKETASTESLVTRCGIGPYNLASDLRRLIHVVFKNAWYSVAPEIDTQVRASDRAMVCARAVESDDTLAPDDLARGTAWTQLAPAAGLFAIWETWPEDVTRLSAYLYHSVHGGASRGSMPLPVASAITAELASRPGQRRWFDQVAAWMEAWVATVPLEGRSESSQVTRLLRRARLMMRLGVSMRALDADVRSPRLLALAELTSVVTLIRAAGRADLMRAYVEADRDPGETARAQGRHDRRADLLFEIAIAAVLRRPSAAELAALERSERRALSSVRAVLAADPGLSQGLLADQG